MVEQTESTDRAYAQGFLQKAARRKQRKKESTA